MARSVAEMNEFIRNERLKMINTQGTNVGVCPNCQWDVIAYDVHYACTGYPHDCDFFLKKSLLRAHGKETITLPEMTALLREEIIDLSNLVSKNGEPFSVGGRLEWNTNYGWGVNFCARPARAPFQSPKPPKTFCRRHAALPTELAVDDSDTIPENPGTQGERENP